MKGLSGSAPSTAALIEPLSTSPREGIGDGTRERILEAALAVLRNVGHGQFSVQKVARQAGVYQGNITYYWPRRRDLVLALAVRVVEDFRRAFVGRFASDRCELGRLGRHGRARHRRRRDL
jgi:AcrR family transcriptional regulator